MAIDIFNFLLCPQVPQVHFLCSTLSRKTVLQMFQHPIIWIAILQPLIAIFLLFLHPLLITFTLPFSLHPQPRTKISALLCDIVIYNNNIYLIFISVSGSEVLKPLGFPNWWEHKRVFCYVDKVTLGLHLRMGLVAAWTNHLIRRLELWNFLFPSFDFMERRGFVVNQ